MRVGVTGSTSGIGDHLIKKVLKLGHTAIPLGRTQINSWRLGEGISQNLKLDVLVHLAHDRSLSVNSNISAAEVLCKSFGGHKIFLSSFSAHSKSKSIYGKSKYELENIFSKFNGNSLRAGIVYGSNVGGFFANLQNLVSKPLVTPIPYRGSPLLFTSHIEDLVDEIIINLEFPKNSNIFAAHPVPISLQELVINIKEAAGIKSFTFPMPREPLDSGLKLLSKIVPSVSIADSLLSLSSQASYEEISRLSMPKTKFRAFDLEI